jgi:hypothetical protein
MNNIKLYALLVSLLICNIINGQYSEFDLSKYKLPDIKTSRFDLNTYLINNYDRSRHLMSDDTIKNSRNTTFGLLDLSYYRFRNTRKYQGDLSIRAIFEPDLDRSTQQDETTRDNSMTANFSVQSINRVYLNNKLFLEADPNFYFSSSKYKYHRDDLPQNHEENTLRHSGRLSIPLSIGYGRIEPVEDARLAIYILEELSRAGRISEIPSEEVILEMAGEISKIKKERFFDTRLRKIAELHVIDSFLIANDLVSLNDITYFSILNDNWDYSGGPQRESGFLINTGLSNRISLSSYKSDIFYSFGDSTSFSRRNNNYLIGGFINMKYAKPLNLYWQVSAIFQTSYNLRFEREPGDSDVMQASSDARVFRTDLGGTIQYLPNSRSSFRLSVSVVYQNANSDLSLDISEPLIFSVSENSLSLYQAFDMYYYVSSRLRIELASYFTLINLRDIATYESTMPEEEASRNFNGSNLTFRLIYSFF